MAVRPEPPVEVPVRVEVGERDPAAQRVRQSRRGDLRERATAIVAVDVRRRTAGADEVAAFRHQVEVAVAVEVTPREEASARGAAGHPQHPRPDVRERDSGGGAGGAAEEGEKQERERSEVTTGHSGNLLAWLAGVACGRGETSPLGSRAPS